MVYELARSSEMRFKVTTFETSKRLVTQLWSGLTYWIVIYDLCRTNNEIGRLNERKAREMKSSAYWSERTRSVS